MNAAQLCTSPSLLFVEPQLNRLVGRTSAALLIRIHYWLQKKQGGITYDQVKFIYNTAVQWADQLGVSSRQIERAISTLRKASLLRIEKLAKHKSIRTNHYAINYDILAALIAEKKSLEEAETSRQNVGKNNTVNTDISKNKIYKKNITKPQDTELTLKLLPGETVVSINSSSSQAIQLEENDQNKVNKNRTQSLNTTVQDMLDCWNKTFVNSRVMLNRGLAKHLYSAFKLKFNSDLNLWKHYCQTIESSSYLTGEKFKLTLFWALKFKTIDRIKTGEFGVKSVLAVHYIKDLEEELKKEIESLEESRNCKNKRFIILRRYGAQQYQSWLRKAVLFEVDKNVYYKAETAYGQSFIENNFGRLILSCPQAIKDFNLKRKSELFKNALIKNIDHLNEADKCRQTRRMLLDLLGCSVYKEFIDNLCFYLEKDTVCYTSNCESHLAAVKALLNSYGI